MNKEEIKKRIEVLDEELEKIEEKSHEMPLMEGWEYYSNHPKMKERENLYRELKLLENYTLSEPLKGKGGRLVGDLMTLKDFITICSMGGFIDDDGHGRYATATQESDLVIYPSDITSGKYRKDFTHVIWYNK